MMKKIILGFAIAATTLAACGINSNKSTESQNGSKDKQAISQTDNATVTDAMNTFSIKEIVSQYLQIKNGLANDNGKDAASAGNAL